MTDREVLFQVKGLRKIFKTSTSWGKPLKIFAVNGVDLDIFKGETLGLVGESGCGKSTFGKTLIRLYKPDGGKLFFKGNDITDLGY